MALMTDHLRDRGWDSTLFLVTLAYPPTWYSSGDFWSTRAYDFFSPTAPFLEKPHASVCAVHTDTLASVIDRAAEELGLTPGPTNHASKMSDFVARMSFYKPSDDAIFDVQRIYQSPRKLPVALDDGTVELRQWGELTVADLLTSAYLGLVDGDPLRPYIAASLPQGTIHEDITLATLHFSQEEMTAARSGLQGEGSSEERAVGYAPKWDLDDQAIVVTSGATPWLTPLKMHWSDSSEMGVSRSRRRHQWRISQQP